VSEDSTVQLLLDVGNTRIKWQLRSSELVESGLANNTEDLFAQLKHVVVDRILLSSVRSVKLTDDLVGLIKNQFNCLVLQAISTLTQCGVTNNYTNPSQLGVDRWLAVIAGYKLAAGSCIVIDAGSAITIDYVDADGVFQGGVIAPGLEMLKQSLKGGTDRVSFESGFSISKNPLGLSTQAAVSSGVMLMLIGFINETLVSLSRHCYESPAIYITGGDAQSIMPYIDVDLRYVDGLVLDGLAHFFSQG